MSLNDLVDLTRKVVHKINKAALSRNVDSSRLASMLKIVIFESNCRIVENLPPRCIIERNQLAGHKVIFYLEEPYIFPAAAHHAVIYH